MTGSRTTRPTPGRQRAPALYAIIAIKLGKALLLLGVALGLYSLLGDDLQAEFHRFARWIRLDPEGRFFAALGNHLDRITPANLRWLASGTLLYSALLLAESAGLALRAGWAVWLAIGETAFFIPIELFELVRRFSEGMAGILVLNALIVLYLVRNRQRLFHHGPRAPGGAGG